MIRLQLDFSRPARVRFRAAWAVLVLGVVVLGASILQAVRLSSVNDSLQAAQDGRTSRGSRVGGAAPGASRELVAEIQQARAVIAALDVPWDRLFTDIEAAARPGIVLTELQPEGEGRRLRLGGDATTFTDLTAYIAGLSQRPTLAKVLLARHERANGVTRFTITAEWRAHP